MSIKLRVPTVDATHVRVSLSPMSELVSSLHVLLHPWAHPLQHPWVREMRSLAPQLKRDVRAWGFMYDSASPDCFLPPDPGREPTFEESLALLEAMEPDRAAYELGRPFFHYSEAQAVGEEALKVARVREYIRDRAQRYFPECIEQIELLLTDPGELQRRAVEFLRRYWEQSFESTWADLEPRLRSEVDRARADVERGRLFELLAPFRSELRQDRERSVLERPSRHEHEVTATGKTPLVLLPSAYVWPHVRVNCDEPWPLAIMYPAAFVADEAARKPAPASLERTMRAVGDSVRLQILRLTAQRPRTTEELAPLVGLSMSGLSKHLRALTDAGLVTSRRDGWYVLYATDRDRLARLSAELLDYLDDQPNPQPP